ncbi:MAG: hypothetical protein U1E70_15320 [Acetobacteraceae bacterium]
MAARRAAKKLQNPTRTRQPAPKSVTGPAFPLGRMLTAFAAAVVFLAAFVVDTAGAMRLAWACLIGRLGWQAQLVTAGLGLGFVGLCIVAWRPGRSVAAPARKPPSGRARPAGDERGVQPARRKPRTRPSKKTQDDGVLT